MIIFAQQLCNLQPSYLRADAFLEVPVAKHPVYFEDMPSIGGSKG